MKTMICILSLDLPQIENFAGACPTRIVISKQSSGKNQKLLRLLGNLNRLPLYFLAFFIKLGRLLSQSQTT